VGKKLAAWRLLMALNTVRSQIITADSLSKSGKNLTRGAQNAAAEKDGDNFH